VSRYFSDKIEYDSRSHASSKRRNKKSPLKKRELVVSSGHVAFTGTSR